MGTVECLNYCLAEVLRPKAERISHLEGQRQSERRIQSLSGTDRWVGIRCHKMNLLIMETARLLTSILPQRITLYQHTLVNDLPNVFMPKAVFPAMRSITTPDQDSIGREKIRKFLARTQSQPLCFCCDFTCSPTSRSCSPRRPTRSARFFGRS